MKRYRLFKNNKSTSPFTSGDSLMELRQDLILEMDVENNLAAIVQDNKTGKEMSVREARTIADRCYQEREQKRLKEEKDKQKQAKAQDEAAYAAYLDRLHRFDSLSRREQEAVRQEVLRRAGFRK